MEIEAFDYQATVEIDDRDIARFGMSPITDEEPIAVVERWLHGATADDRDPPAALRDRQHAASVLGW